MNSKKLAKYLIVVAAIGTIFTACKKDRIEERTLNDYSSPNSYLDSKKQEEQEFVITSDSASGPIVGNQGTNVWIGRQCLMFPNGDTVGLPFTVKLVELYKPKDMIYYQMPTVASDTILETDGEIRLRAFKNGVELVIVPGCFIPIKMPNTAPKNYMRVFYGFPASNYTNWTDNPATLGVTSSFTPTFSTTTDGYLGSIVKLGWINCGITRGSGTNHNLSFISSTDILTNVAIFVYFPATKTVMQVYNVASGSIPTGSAVKIIAIAVDAGGTLYSFNQNMTVSASSQIDVTMTATNDASLTALLDGL